MILNKVRNIFFWAKDASKGSPLKKNLKEIEFCVNNSNSAKAIGIKNMHFKRLLNHAIETTPFYKEYASTGNISSFPVINKKIIQKNFESFKSSKHIDKNNFKASTSGSTGTPLTVFQNPGKRLRNHADVIFFLNHANYNVGDKLYKLHMIHEDNKKGKFGAWLQNVSQFDISRLTNESIIVFLNLLKSDKNSKITILGFASALQIIAKYLEKNKIFLKNIEHISGIAYAEYLNPYTKSIFEKHLNISLLSRYSNNEVGIIAQQTLKSKNRFVINHGSYYVELLCLDTDVAVNPGEFGRIVVTDLFNYAMPLIRYDTGDIAKLYLNDSGVTELEQIEGRKMDLLYDSKGNIISSFVVYTNFLKYYRLIKQYQFIQQGEKTYEVKLNLHEADFPYANELINGIKTDFGADIEVTISYVNQIPPLASGKRNYVINNFKNR